MLEATPEVLIARYNEMARAVRSLNAGVDITPATGSTYSGVIEDYHEVSGFVLAQKPSSIRMIGQAPVLASNIFDMVSDGETFRIFIPPRSKFIVGPAHAERPSAKPLENLRPQHLLDAFFWPEITEGQPVLFEEFNATPERYYVLTVLRSGPPLEIARKIWFDRADLNVERLQTFEPGGRLAADVLYADWQPAGETRYPRQVTLSRPHDDYKLDLHITKLTLNEELTPDRFRLEQPPGTELVRVGEASAARP